MSVRQLPAADPTGSTTVDGTPLDTENLPTNVAMQFLDRVAHSGPRTAFQYAVGERWESVSWHDAGARVKQLAAGLLSLGLRSEQRVAIISSTRYDWIVADLAVMCAAGATTTVYPNTGADDTSFIVRDSESRIAFVEDAEQLAKLDQQRDTLPLLTSIISFDPSLSDGVRVMSLDELAAAGDALLSSRPELIEQTARQISADQLATLIYTSGTTGQPKGVRTVHRAWVFQGHAVQAQGTLSESDLHYLWLPLSHAFGKALLSAQLTCGFATAVDGRVDKIFDNLAVVRPTFMGAAPRIFEKAYARVSTSVAGGNALKRSIFAAAFNIGIRVARRRQEGLPVPRGLAAMHALFDRLVFGKIRDRFGGRIRFFISGAAALNADIAAWFDAAGLIILEGYGMTENAAAAAINHPSDYRIGTVGRPIPGTSLRVDAAGEVQIKGPHVMAGYHNLPDATADVLTPDGWLRTGDKGELVDGRLAITGRIKELFKTSGGKYVAPPAIEAKFKTLCPYASQFVVFGAERNFVSALITLDPEAIAEWARGVGMESWSYADIVAADATVQLIAGYVDKVNAQLNRWETVKKWQLIDHDLTVESGELTPSMKVRRAVVEQRNSALIASFYN